MGTYTGIRRFTTKRFIFSAAGIALATVELEHGKLSGTEWVYSLAIIIAGHHAPDLIKAWRSPGAA